MQLYWNRTSAWVFYCKFAGYFQNTFSKEHLWVAASKSWLSLQRSSHRRCSVKEGVLINFAKFTGKHLRQSLFFEGLRPATLLKKRLCRRSFLVSFANFLRILFLQNTSGRLLLTPCITYSLYIRFWCRCTEKIDVLKNITGLTEFSCEFCEIFENTFSIEPLRKTADVDMENI